MCHSCILKLNWKKRCQGTLSVFNNAAIAPFPHTPNSSAAQGDQ